MSQTVLKPELRIDDGLSAGRWMVVIHNNDTNGFDEVIEVLMLATGCGLDEAATEAWEAHHFGKAPVHFADRPTCETIAEIIASIGVRTDVEPEWDE